MRRSQMGPCIAVATILINVAVAIFDRARARFEVNDTKPLTKLGRHIGPILNAQGERHRLSRLDQFASVTSCVAVSS